MSNYNSQLQSNNTDLQTVLQTLQTKAAGGEQATPVISVNSTNGLITATAGTKTSTHQLAFQAAKTITPSTASQIAVSSGYYTGGNITVAGDSNLVAGNIKSGVSIFGVSGTLVEGSGGDTSLEDALVIGTMSNYTNSRVSSIGQGAFAFASTLNSVNFPNVTSIGVSAFYYCSKLTTVNFPVCISIGSGAFSSCASLTTISFPVCTSIGSNAFQNCSSLTIANFPVCTSISSNAFYYCFKLTTVSFPVCRSINNYAFQNCRTLSSLTLGGSSVCTLNHSNAFSSTPYTGYSASFSGTPYIYVPSSLLTSYKTATNWTYFSSYFSAVESLDGGNLITFTIAGTGYQAEEGMTWEEWVGSEYNTIGAFSDGENVLVEHRLYPMPVFIIDENYNPVIIEDIIISGYGYDIEG